MAEDYSTVPEDFSITAEDFSMREKRFSIAAEDFSMTKTFPSTIEKYIFKAS
jgi:hypothetical protein